MDFMSRVARMDPGKLAARPEVRALWGKSLLWSLAHRRSFKCFLGSPRPSDGFFDYREVKEPLPLSEVELALLCWAGAGTNGLIRNDVTFAQDACTHPWFEGRVYPSACNVWYVHLLLATDEGVFLYRPHVPTRIVEIETQEDMEVIFQAFKDCLVQLSHKPLWQTEQELAGESSHRPKAAKTSHGGEAMFQPGGVYFFPLVDVTVEMINIYFMLHGLGTELIDDATGDSAGVSHWVDKGLLNQKKLPLSTFEVGMIQILTAHQYYIHQNLQLCATAMGLGAYVTGGGYASLMMLHEAMNRSGTGFRFGADHKGEFYPVGIDGVIETHLPPYMSMDQAVQDVWDMKFGPGYGRYDPAVKEGQAVMYPGFDRRPRQVHRPFKEPEKYTKAAWAEPMETLEIAKDVANYIYKTYRRFPKSFNPLLCESFVQVSHLDLDFYDQYLKEGSTWEEQREHIRLWHGVE